MYCISKKFITISGFIVSIFFFTYIVNLTAQKGAKPFRSRASPNSFCESVGLYSVEGEWATNYYDSNCSKNKSFPLWNGEKGDKAKCYTATALCSKYPVCNSTDCILSTNKNIKCINEPVNISKCIEANAVTYAQLSEYVCMYNSEVVTATSRPYYYADLSTQTLGESTPIQTTYKCIKNNGYNVGVRCITDAEGKIIANYNKEDKINCPVNAPTIQQATLTPQPQSTSAPGQPTDTQTAPTAQPAQPSNCNETKFSGYNCGVEGWKIGGCQTDTNGVSRKCGCDPNNTWISYPILYEVNSCP